MSKSACALLPTATVAVPLADALSPIATAPVLPAVPPAFALLPIAMLVVPFATPPAAAKELSPVAWLPFIPPNATARLPLAVTQPRATAPP